jgi:hypothetical protein
VDGDPVSVVVCRNVDCPSQGEARDMELWVDIGGGARKRVDAIVCGACSSPIVDVVSE